MDLWSIQDAVRRNNLMLPGVLLFMASGCVLYHHFTLKEGDDTSMRGFLFLVCISMLPLAYVDAKIGSCADPAGLFCKFGHKIVLLHAIFLALRCYSRLYNGDHYVTGINVYGLAVAAAALVIGFRTQVSSLNQNLDVLTICALCLVYAIGTEVFTSSLSRLGVGNDFYHPDSAAAMIEATGEYIEILSFLPAAWIIFRHEKKDGGSVDAEDFKRSAMCFSGFGFAFYMLEDVITAFVAIGSSKMEAFAHILHFLLLADFCAYILGIAYNPNVKSSGTFLQRFGGACALDTFV